MSVEKQAEEAIAVVVLKPAQWREYRALRLEALKTVPQAFGASYKEAVTEPPKKWKSALEKSDGRQLLFARVNGDLAGLMSILRSKPEKLRHIATIYQVYVQPAYRGRGVSSLLLQEALRIAKRWRVHKISLTVNCEQSAAIHLYEKYGFKIVGTVRDELKINRRYYDEHIMELIVNY